jgi:hypothetical protein
VNENFKEIQSDMNYVSSELSMLKKQLEEVQEKQRLTKKNLVRIIDTFTLSEYVLFKSRLLTKKQTIDLLDNLYNYYDIEESFRNSDGIDKIQTLIKTDQMEITLGEKKMCILSEVDALKGILDKLNEPKLKDSEYALAKARWSNQDNSEFLDTVVKFLKN